MSHAKIKHYGTETPLKIVQISFFLARAHYCAGHVLEFNLSDTGDTLVSNVVIR